MASMTHARVRAKGIASNPATASGTPTRIQGFRRPQRVHVESLRTPAQGWITILMRLSQVMIKNARLGASANPTSGACRPVGLCHSGWPAWSNTGTNVSKTGAARDAAYETRPRNNARRQRKGSMGASPFPVMFATGWRVPVDRTCPHSTELCGRGHPRSAEAARGEDLQVEHPVCGGQSTAFHFHPTLARVQGPALVRNQVVPSAPALSETPAGSLWDGGIP